MSKISVPVGIYVIASGVLLGIAVAVLVIALLDETGSGDGQSAVVAILSFIGTQRHHHRRGRPGDSDGPYSGRTGPALVSAYQFHSTGFPIARCRPDICLLSTRRWDGSAGHHSHVRPAETPGGRPRYGTPPGAQPARAGIQQTDTPAQERRLSRSALPGLLAHLGLADFRSALGERATNGRKTPGTSRINHQKIDSRRPIR